MQIKSIHNTMNFKSNYTSDDLYRLEQKLDSLQAKLDRDDLDSYYRDIQKARPLPMPTGVPPYAMNGMMGMYGMPPMGMPPGRMPWMPGGYYGSTIGTYGLVPPPGGIYGPPPMGMPPAGSTSRLSGQPCKDIFCPRK